MREFDYKIQDEQGIHARPAGILVKEASGFQSDIHIEKDGKTGDLKRIFSVMALGVKRGDKVHITFEGSDEDLAAEKLEALFKENL